MVAEWITDLRGKPALSDETDALVREIELFDEDVSRLKAEVERLKEALRDVMATPRKRAGRDLGEIIVIMGRVAERALTKEEA